MVHCRRGERGGGVRVVFGRGGGCATKRRLSHAGHEVPKPFPSPLLASVPMCRSLSSVNGVRVLGALVLGIIARSWCTVD